MNKTTKNTGEQWIDISKRIFNYSNGTRKMVRNVLGWTRSGEGFSMYVATQEEAEAIRDALMDSNEKEKK